MRISDTPVASAALFNTLYLLPCSLLIDFWRSILVSTNDAARQRELCAQQLADLVRYTACYVVVLYETYPQPL